MEIKLFENEELFKSFSSQYGINLFIGAGFSTYAYNSDNESLPLGNLICQRLIQKFEIDNSVYSTLSKVCRKIKRTQNDALNIYLREIYKVREYDESYKLLPSLPIKNIISTNIDDLIEQIYSNPDSNKDISDVHIYGDIQKDNTVPLYKLHGSITYPFNETLSFTPEELNSLFITNNSLFQTVSYKLSNCPCLFWGTSLEDGNINQIINCTTFGRKSNLPKWVVVYPKDEKYKYLLEEYHDLGFNIIVADTKDLLIYLSKMPFVTKSDDNRYIYKKYKDSFTNNFVCKELKKSALARPINEFFQGAEPQISDVLSSNIVRTSYFSTLHNSIMANHITLITGIPGCGKSTLLLQLAFSDELQGRKFWFPNILPSEASRLCSLLKDDDKAIVFIDNLYSNLEAYEILKKQNIKLVVAERGINYEYIKTFLNISSKAIIDISNLEENDIQNVCIAMNKPSTSAIELLRNKSNVSLLEIVFIAYHSVTVIDRIKQYIIALRDFVDSNLKIDLLELFALINYISFCGVPTTLDMLIFYFYSDNIDYTDIYYALDKLNGIIVNDPNCSTEDRIVMRSKLFSEMSIKYLPANITERVLVNFFKNVSTSTIYRYDIFKKKAYDADITTRAFNKSSGIEFYSNVIKLNNSPYIKHQFALFLRRKKDIDNAWRVIDQAYTDCNGKIFTIANTHAIILFEKNISKNCSEFEIPKLKSILNQSFETLEYCVTKDVRLNYHVLIYARHTSKYIDRFGIDAYSETYVKNAVTRIRGIINSDEYIYMNLKQELVELCSSLSKYLKE